MQTPSVFIIYIERIRNSKLKLAFMKKKSCFIPCFASGVYRLYKLNIYNYNYIYIYISYANIKNKYILIVIFKKLKSKKLNDCIKYELKKI